MNISRWAWLIWLPLLVACGGTLEQANNANPPLSTGAPTANTKSSTPVTTSSTAIVPTIAPTTAAATVAVPTLTPERDSPLAPELLGGQSWVNSTPLTLASLRGKVVLIDFWTRTCYNCRNTLPALRGWWDKYKDQGLVIIGVHTPEFQSEHDLGGVQDAVKQQQIGWPVVQDNDYKIWSAYNNRYWPRFYLVDHQGHIIYDHIGEGAYDETERQIVVALTRAKQQTP